MTFWQRLVDQVGFHFGMGTRSDLLSSPLLPGHESTTPFRSRHREYSKTDRKEDLLSSEDSWDSVLSRNQVVAVEDDKVEEADVPLGNGMTPRKLRASPRRLVSSSIQSTSSIDNNSSQNLDKESFMTPSQRNSRPRTRLTPRKQSQSTTPTTTRKILVLDLDETLIHSTTRSQAFSLRPALSVELIINQHPCIYYVYKRPYCDEFLRTANQWFQLVIYTASMASYANPVIDHLEQSSGVPIPEHCRFFRESCTVTMSGRVFLKDLSVVLDRQMPNMSGQHVSNHGNSISSLEEDDLPSTPEQEDPMKHVILVDNSLMSFGLQPRNGVPIESWICDPVDEGLLDLLTLLDGLRFVDDVRSILGLRVI